MIEPLSDKERWLALLQGFGDVHLTKEDAKGNGDFQKAVDLEKKLQERDPDVYFHDTCQPLNEVGFNEEQGDMFSKPCASGMCFT